MDGARQLSAEGRRSIVGGGQISDGVLRRINLLFTIIVFIRRVYIFIEDIICMYVNYADGGSS